MARRKKRRRNEEKRPPRPKVEVLIKVPHESLCPGDACPECGKGKVYEQKDRPHLLVRMQGQAPIKATVYEKQTLRCNLCGKVFVCRNA